MGELIIETPFQIQSVKLIHFAFNDSSEASEDISYEYLLLRCPRLFLLVDLDSKAVFRTYAPLNEGDQDIVDCVFVEEFRLFLVATAGGFLITVPDTCQDATKCPRLKWPVEPKELFCNGDRKRSLIIAACADQTFCHIKLSIDGLLVPPQVDPLRIKAQSKLVRSSFTFSGFFSTITETGPKKSFSINLYTLSELLPGSCLWLTPSSTSTLAFDSILSDKLELVSAVYSEIAESVFILLSSSSLLKFDNNGQLLFRRSVQLGDVSQLQSTTTSRKRRRSISDVSGRRDVSQLAEVSGQLWVLHETTGKISSWSSSYGTLLQEISLAEVNLNIGALEGASYWFLPSHFESAASKRNQRATSYGCQLVVADTTGSSTAVRSVQLSSKSFSGKLSDAVGALTKKKGIDSIVTYAEGTKLYTVNGGKVFILSEMSAGNAKTALLQCIDQFIEAIKKEEKQHSLAMKSNKLILLDSEKGSKFYLDVPLETCNGYLSRVAEVFRQVENCDLSHEDWALLLALIHSRNISIVKHPFLLPLASQNLRIDGLKEMILHVADFSELHCVKMLRFCLLLPDHALAEALINCGVRAKKGKSAQKKASDAEAGSCLLEDGSTNFAGQRVALLQEFLQAALCRESAYSPVLLSEAVREALSAEMAVTVLRILALLLRGLCSKDAAVSDSWDCMWGKWQVLDHHIKRAVGWMEAIIDGHFSALAMNALLDESTRKGLMTALEAVVSADEAAAEAEELLGLWTHISRVINHGGQEVRVPLGIFQVEKLLL